MKHVRVVVLLIVALVPAGLFACDAETTRYAQPPKLPPCPRVIGSIYTPSVATSARAAASTESEAVVTAAAAAPSASAAHAREAYKPAPRPVPATSPLAGCGDKKNPCPLQRWMREKMAPALAANDAPALASALDQMARLSPLPGPEWKAISEIAAAAARRGDVAGARKSCQGCHTAFKASYKQKLRTRPAP